MPLRTLFLGRKPSASAALESLVERGVEVAGVVAPSPDTPDVYWRPTLGETAQRLGLPVRTADWLEGPAESREEDREVRIDDIDLVISFLYWRRIQAWLIELPRIGCFNVHPGPLPEFRGRRGYNHAILEGHARYGATIHWVSQDFDEGDLVEVRTFDFDPDIATALSLERRTTEIMLQMFDDFLDLCESGAAIPREPQGPGRTATKSELLALMPIETDDDAETVARKVRAFWYPPFPGATVKVLGRPYTLVDDAILRDLGRLLHQDDPER